ncbi:hypothetical protein TNIN_102981 [Trichonephila inaurata madagascariensis]|uniref:Uncharacterized protein n=1 Tax=Trichonephila inaurata madagascariensis TaxID=2747483 RepID=A0A8X6WZQ8_9ARAC|nr:hypothetical protein TNIN_102981 [Trichonephila inaurata madagascariensis]
MPGLCGRPGLSSVPFPHSQCIPPPCISPSAQFITLEAEWGKHHQQQQEKETKLYLVPLRREEAQMMSTPPGILRGTTPHLFYLFTFVWGSLSAAPLSDW